MMVHLAHAMMQMTVLQTTFQDNGMKVVAWTAPSLKKWMNTTCSAHLGLATKNSLGLSILFALMSLVFTAVR